MENQKHPTGHLQLSIVVPTFNEKENIRELVHRVSLAIPNINWEMIFVDDNSPDHTHEIVKELSLENSKVRCIRRIGRRGLSGACIEGMLSSAAPYLAVMDADLQHDERILADMYKSLTQGRDLAIATRYQAGGSATEGFTKTRELGSKFATILAKKTLSVETTDPMSGFFMIDRKCFDEIAPNLSKDGFKLLLDILASSDHKLNVSEHTYNFRERLNGESKLDTLVTIDYLGLLLSKITGGLLPVRFLLFATVGVSGLFIHLASLAIINYFWETPFSTAQLTATMIAMTWNYALNNQLTFRDSRLRGLAYIRGLITFYVACSIGTLANVGASTWLYQFDKNAILAGFAGALIGSVFNYTTTSIFTWKR